MGTKKIHHTQIDRELEILKIEKRNKLSKVVLGFHRTKKA
jgi:hypothetical protein